MIKVNNFTLTEFNKYIVKHELSEDDFKVIFEELNDVYYEKSQKIIEEIFLLLYTYVYLIQIKHFITHYGQIT